MIKVESVAVTEHDNYDKHSLPLSIPITEKFNDNANQHSDACRCWLCVKFDISFLKL